MSQKERKGRQGMEIAGEEYKEDLCSFHNG